MTKPGCSSACAGVARNSDRLTTAPHSAHGSRRRASALLETGIVETIHPAFAHEHLPAGTGGHPPTGFQRQRRGVRVAGEESRDLGGILPLEHGTGDIQELTAWR